MFAPFKGKKRLRRREAVKERVETKPGLLRDPRTRSIRDGSPAGPSLESLPQDLDGRPSDPAWADLAPAPRGADPRRRQEGAPSSQCPPRARRRGGKWAGSALGHLPGTGSRPPASPTQPHPPAVFKTPEVDKGGSEDTDCGGKEEAEVHREPPPTQKRHVCVLTHKRSLWWFGFFFKENILNDVKAISLRRPCLAPWRCKTADRKKGAPRARDGLRASVSVGAAKWPAPAQGRCLGTSVFLGETTCIAEYHSTSCSLWWAVVFLNVGESSVEAAHRWHSLSKCTAWIQAGTRALRSAAPGRYWLEGSP